LTPRGVLAGLALFLILGASGSAPIRVSAQEAAAEVAKRKVKTRVQPEYSALARQMKVTGKAKIEVTISPDGRVTSTRTVGGNPLLVASSLEALKKWRFEPGPKETTEIIEFNFTGQE
jgi:TonB family protein